MGKTNFDYKGKVVLVTGGVSGIGWETALEFANRGGRVIISDLREEEGKKSAELLRESGGEVEFIPCDVSKPDEVERLISMIIKKYGKLDAACNNAGIEGQMGSTVECQLENWDRVISTNLKGVWLCLKYEIEAMLKTGGGSIVNLSSIAGLIGFPGLPAYVASKHGVAGLTKTAALEFAAQNIRVNAVCPGPIMTPMLERIMESTPGFKEQVVSGVPERRIGQPKDVAQAILFLCSEEASYITGQCLPIDGGWVAQ